MFSYSQDDWESNLNLTYPLFKLNGQRTSRLHVKLLYRGALYVTIWLCSILSKTWDFSRLSLILSKEIILQQFTSNH